MNDTPMMPVPHECRFCKWYSLNDDRAMASFWGPFSYCGALPYDVAPRITIEHEDIKYGWRGRKSMRVVSDVRISAAGGERTHRHVKGGDTCVLWEYKEEKS